MFSIFKNIFNRVNNKLALGAGNVCKQGESEEEVEARYNLICYYRELEEEILTSLLVSGEIKGINETELFHAVILALFAEIYQMGCCGEYAAVGLIEILTTGIRNKRLESITIQDDALGSNHACLLYNRKLGSRINEPSEYGNVTLFDTWPGVSKLKEYSGKGKNIFSDKNFINDEIKQISSIECDFEIKTDLASSDWRKISRLLHQKKDLITLAFVNQKIKEFAIPALKADVEVKKISTKFSEKIQKYGTLSDLKSSLAFSLVNTFSLIEKQKICNQLFRITGVDWKYSVKENAACLILKNVKVTKRIMKHLKRYGVAKLHMDPESSALIVKPHNELYLKKIPALKISQSLKITPG